MSNLLTNSRLKSARACQRLHDIEYVQCFRLAEEPEVFRFGSLVHLGLKAWWEWAPELATSRLAAAHAAVQLAAEPFELVRAEEMLRGYDARWVAEPYEVLAVEVEFQTPLRNPETGASSRTWRLAGKLDAVVRDLRDGRVLLVEHKTSSEDIAPGSEYWRRLRMDGQVSVYYLGAEALGWKVDGCLYDVLGKPGIRPLKATPEESRKYTKQGVLYANQRDKDETPGEFRARLVEDIASCPDGYYQRGEVVRLETEMADALHDVWQLGRQIREAELAKRSPRNPDACVRFGRTCPYFSVCTGEESLVDNPRFVRSTAHPELAGEAPREETTNAASDAAEASQ